VKFISLLVGIIFFLTTFSLICETTSATGTTWHVSATGAGNYSHIQDAIDNATKGDSIIVGSGVYHESILITKQITIQGENKDTTILEGGSEKYICFLVQMHGAAIRGFTIQNYTMGICVLPSASSSTTTIADTIITNNRCGICLKNLSTNTLISSNMIINNIGDGIRLYHSYNNTISNNVISEQKGFGIDLWDSSCYNSINNNTICKNLKGISLQRWSDSNTISCNNISKNSATGIFLDHSFFNSITKNTLHQNSNGIYLEACSYNTISANIISSSHKGIALYDSANNSITEDNYFSDNEYDVYKGSKGLATPGFELLLLISALFSFFFCNRIKK
jgi:parallel beta-helix repeat protein